MDTATLSMTQLAAAVRRRDVSARDVVQAAVERAQRAQPALNAFIDIFPDEALARAERVDQSLAQGEFVGPLAGIPFVVKDNLCLAHGRTTCASRMLESYRSPYTATSVQRLLDAGAVVIAKANLDEFAMGSSGENSAFGPTRNPRDPSRVPGGSSSGSAAAVAADVVPMALGSDTGGSIRQPASFCGVVGLKPTYGRVSRSGLVAYASSLDQVGPITRSVADAAVTLSIIAGHDAHDATSGKFPHADFLRDLDVPVRELRIGVPKQARAAGDEAGAGNHPAVAAGLEAAIDALRAAGAAIVDIDLPHARFGIAAYYLIAVAEASSNLARFDGVRYGRRAELRPDQGLDELYARSRAEGLGPEVRRRILLGTHALSAGYADAYYTTAAKVRRLIRDDFNAALHGVPGCHAILMPAAPTPAFKLGEKISDPLALYLEDIYTVGVNLAGLPAISVPAHIAQVDAAALPVGVQLIGAALGEASLLRVARTLEVAVAQGTANRPPPAIRHEEKS